MKTDKNVSRRQFLLVGALTGGGLVLSESGCASGGSGEPKRKYQTGNLPELKNASLKDLVGELHNCHPLLRDPDDNTINVFSIAGAANPKNPPPSEYDTKHLGTPTSGMTMYHILQVLFPHIVFTVSGASYVLTFSGLDPNETALLVEKSLQQIFDPKKPFCVQVNYDNGVARSYTVTAKPLFDQNCHKEKSPYDPIGDLTLDVLGDALEYMEFTITDGCPGSAHVTNAVKRTVRVACNKHRQE